MSKNRDLLTNLRAIANNVNFGNRTAADVADSVNVWLKDGGEALRVRIEDEVERSVTKMGFIKRGEFEALKEQVAALTEKPAKRPAKRPAKKPGAKTAQAKVKKGK